MPRAARPGSGVLLALSLIAGCASNGPVPALDDADLVAAQGRVEDASNGFLRLEEAAAELFWSHEDWERLNSLGEEGAWDADFIADVVGRNETALGGLERVFASPSFVSPPMESVVDDVPDMTSWVALAALSALRAILRAEAGDVEGAYSDALAPIRLGQIVQSDASAALLHGIVGARIKSLGYYAFASLLPVIYPSPEQSRSIARQVGALETDPSAWRSIWSFEYQVMAPSLADSSLTEGMEEDEAGARWALRLLPDSYAYHPAETLRTYADQVRELRSYAGRPCSEVRPAPDAGVLSRIVRSLSPNGVGRTRLARGARRLRYFELRRCESDTQLAAIQALVALRAYQVVHGTLPPDLESLVPDYLDELPIDAYDGAPLRYDPERAILYSVGSSLRGTEPLWIQEDGSYLAPSYPIGFANDRDRPATGAGAGPAKADGDCCE